MPGSLENDRATDLDALAKQHLDWLQLKAKVWWVEFTCFVRDSFVAQFGSKDNTSCVDMCPPIYIYLMKKNLIWL